MTGRGWRVAHLAVGGLLLVVFLGTGGYMKVRFPGLYAGNEAVRYQYRANHVDILSCGLLHLVLAASLVGAGPRRPRLASAGSALMLLAAPLLVAAFFLDPPVAGPTRPLTGAGVFALAIGVVLQLVAGRRPRGHETES